MIELSSAGPLATITLSRPPLNALEPGLVGRIDDALDAIEARAELSVLRICSTERVFCAGADLAFMAANFGSERGRERIQAFVATVQALCDRIERLPVVSVAQIEGPAVGGGLELALACDFRFIADTASVGLPEVGLGLIPGAGGTQRLTRIAGPAVARRMILAGQRLLAGEAVQAGVCDFSAPPADVDAEALAFASKMAASPRDALVAGRRCIVAAIEGGRGGFAQELDSTAALLASATTQERVRAFLERHAKRRSDADVRPE